jgi:hypothetical protein
MSCLPTVTSEVGEVVVPGEVPDPARSAGGEGITERDRPTTIRIGLPRSSASSFDSLNTLNPAVLEKVRRLWVLHTG